MVSVRDAVAPRDLHRLCVRSAQFRATTEGGVTDGRTLEGYAAVFDAPTEIDSWEGVFEEVVKPGAFRRTLRSRRPVMQFDHGNDKRIGTAPIGSIQDVREDDEGLFVRARLFDTERVEDIRQAIESRAIRGMSFKFEVLDDRWLDQDGSQLNAAERADLMEQGDLVRREITEVRLYELGPVVFPAYDQTSVGVRSDFDPTQLAVRGVIGQFGLTERCVRRHLSVFDADARQALAAEIRRVFPELLDLPADQGADALTQDPPPEPEENSTASDPATRTSDVPEPAVSTSGVSASPAVSHLASSERPHWLLNPYAGG